MIKRKKMEGFIIKGEDGSYLDRDFFWGSFTETDKIPVHSKEEVDTIRNRCKNWFIKPVVIIPAVTHTEITGKEIKF